MGTDMCHGFRPLPGRRRGGNRQVVRAYRSRALVETVADPVLVFAREIHGGDDKVLLLDIWGCEADPEE